MHRRTVLIIGLAATSLFIGVSAGVSSREEPQIRARLVARSEQTEGYLQVEGPAPLAFPKDHGPHPDYQTEWWYFTGNLQTRQGRHFGYQLTFFRSALLPTALRQERQSRWASDQVYMAHFALTNVAANRFESFERFSRGAAGLAGAQSAPFSVWLEDWSVLELEPRVYLLHASQEGLELDLQLSDLKGPVLQGDGGYSQKGADPGNASTYYTLTRLAATGTVRVDDEAYQVDGLSWMDHEYSTSALGGDLVGWDWFSIQLDDGSELMVYQLRKEDGSIDPYSSGTYVGADGRSVSLGHQNFEVSIGATWRSPHSGANYPARWTISVPAARLELEITPFIADQELNVSFTYWEGAVQVTGQHDGRVVSGNGYVELTGYSSSMQGQF